MPDWEGKARSVFQMMVSRKGAPYILEIHPTSRCNLHCVFCHQGSNRTLGNESSSGEMETLRWLEIIDEAARHGVHEIRICGNGEPMYDSHASMQLFRRIKKHGMTGCLTTNGTLFTEDSCREIVDLGWDKIEFSVDGACAETHEMLRRVHGCFKRTLEAIETICALKSRAGLEKPSIIINFVVTSCNFEELPALVKLFGPMGVNQILLLDLHPGGEAGNSLVIAPDQRASLWQSLRSAELLARRYEMAFSNDIIVASQAEVGQEGAQEVSKPKVQGSPAFSSSTPLPEDKGELVRSILSPCYEPWYYMQILHDGTYSPCCNSYVDRFAESFPEAAFGELWQKGKHLTTVRNNLTQGVFKGVCRKCDVVNKMKMRKIRQYLLNLCEEDGILSPEEVQDIRDFTGTIVPGEQDV